MNKFTLFFFDSKLEELYQSQSLQKIRITHFHLLTKGYMASFLFRCLTYLIDADLIRFYPNLFMLLFFLLIVVFLKRHNLSLRILSVIANHVMTLFLYIYDDDVDVAVSYLKGINAMGASFLITMGSEFPEALLQVTSIAIIRIIFFLKQSNNLSLFPIPSLLIVSIVQLFFLYKYNQAMRAQFMLIQKDRQWEGILKQLIDKKSYVILNFNENSFQFEYLLAQNFTNCLKNKEDIFNFFKEAQYEKQSLNNYLYYQMKQYQQKRIDLYKQEILVKHLRELIKLEISIFFSNQPTILIVFHKPKLRIQNTLSTVKNNTFFQYFVHLLKSLKKQCKSKPSYINLMKKIRIIEIYQNLQGNWEQTLQEINICHIISQQAKYHPNIMVLTNIQKSITLKTNQDILSLILFQIFSNTGMNKQKNTYLINVIYSLQETDRIQLIFCGNFFSSILLSFFNFHKESLSRFVVLDKITNHSICISFEINPLIPFTGKENNNHIVNQ